MDYFHQKLKINFFKFNINLYDKFLLNYQIICIFMFPILIVNFIKYLKLKFELFILLGWKYQYILLF